MAINKKSKKLRDDQKIGKNDAGMSIKNGDANEQGRGRGNGQQGAGGLDDFGVGKTPDQAGSQPHLGGAEVSISKSTPGTGLTENRDPLSRRGLPNLTDRPATDHSDARPEADSDR